MTTNIVIVTFGVFLAWMYRNRDRETGAVKIPTWLWKAIGLFLLFMLIIHLSDALSFLRGESDDWWPVVKKQAHNLSVGLRHLLEKIQEN